MDIIDINVTAAVHYVSGVPIADPDHLRRWVVADGQWYGGGRNHITFEVCPAHPDPDGCHCTTTEQTVCRLDFVSADW